MSYYLPPGSTNPYTKPNDMTRAEWAIYGPGEPTKEEKAITPDKVLPFHRFALVNRLRIGVGHAKLKKRLSSLFSLSSETKIQDSNDVLASEVLRLNTVVRNLTTEKEALAMEHERLIKDTALKDKKLAEEISLLEFDLIYQESWWKDYVDKFASFLRQENSDLHNKCRSLKERVESLEAQLRTKSL